MSEQAPRASSHCVPRTIMWERWKSAEA